MGEYRLSGIPSLLRIEAKPGRDFLKGARDTWASSMFCGFLERSWAARL